MEPVESKQVDLAPGESAVTDERAARGPSFWFDVQVWARDILISIVIAAVVIVFLYQPVKVEGTSMMPWLEDQQRIFVNKFVYRFENIHRGDIVVFRFPLDPTKSYIKRVVGMPGDVIAIADADLSVNGERFEEPYVPAEYHDRGSYPPLKVPPGNYYVLGDHRNTSNDSRSGWTVPQANVIGKAVFAYWPPQRFGVLE
jgi:signal peptidase I